MSISAQTENKLEEQKSLLERKLVLLNKTKETAEQVLSKEKISLFADLITKISKLANDFSIDSLKFISSYNQIKLENYAGYKKEINDLNLRLFDLQKNIKDNEEEYFRLLKEWRIKWDLYIQVEHEIKTLISKNTSEIKGIIERVINATEEKLLLLKENIRFAEIVNSVDNINKNNLVNTLTDVYGFAFSDDVNLNNSSKKVFLEKDSILLSQSVKIIKDYSAEEIIAFGKKFNELLEKYKRNDKIKIKSIASITDTLAFFAESAGKLMIKNSVDLDNCLPVIEGEVESADSNFVNRESFYVRKTPVSVLEYNLFLLSRKQTKLSDENNSSGFIALPVDDILAFSNWCGFNLLNKSEKKFIYYLKLSESITPDYRNKLGNLTFEKNFLYLKVSDTVYNDSTAGLAKERIKTYWNYLHPRRMILQIGLGSAYQSLRFDNIAGKTVTVNKFANIDFEAVLAYRFRFISNSGDDSYSDFAGTYFLFSHDLSDKCSQSESNPITISKIKHDSYEAGLVYCLRNFLTVGLGIGKTQIDFTDKLQDTETYKSINESFYSARFKLGFQIIPEINIGLDTKFHYMNNSKNLYYSLGMNLSANLMFLRF